MRHTAVKALVSVCLFVGCGRSEGSDITFESDSEGGGGAAVIENDGDSSFDGSKGVYGGPFGEVSLPDGVSFEYEIESRPFEPCLVEDVESEAVYLDMFVMLDKSGSMTWGADGSGSNDPAGYCDIGDPNIGSRWCNSINALHGFFQRPDALNMGVGYGEFSTGSCDAYPMDVEFDVLEELDENGHIAAIAAAMNDDDPAGGTNTEGAVRTLIAETSLHLPTRLRRSIAILVTDGMPSEDCRDGLTEEEHLIELNGMLTEHYENTGVPTFVIGVDGVKADRLEILAAGAGAAPHVERCIPGDDECSYYSVGDGSPDVFEDALAAIRGAVLGCEYVVPTSDMKTEDIASLRVTYTPSLDADAKILTRVDDSASCREADQYYLRLDANENLTVHLCPSACDQRAVGATVELALECKGA